MSSQKKSNFLGSLHGEESLAGFFDLLKIIMSCKLKREFV